VPGRRLEDKIRELCAQAVYEEGHCWRATLGELQVAIEEHVLKVANTSAAATVIGRPDLVRERRKA
jgi:hypothetical protein